MAVTNAIDNTTNLRPKIKWPNDILINDKKVCGILSECMLSSEFGNIEYLICGIGINVNNSEFDKNISATSLFLESRKKQDRINLINEILKEIEKLYKNNNLLKNPSEIISAYKRDLTMLNEQVSFIENNVQKQGIAKDIDENGRLVILYSDGSEKPIISGEIKLRRQNINEQS